VALHVQERLQLSSVRVVGPLDMPCRRIAFEPGYRGSGALVIPLLQGPYDVVIAGEGQEWEAPEYVRDAVAQGLSKALIIVGHLKSEEGGMKYLAHDLADLYPHLPVKFLPEEESLRAVGSYPASPAP
jgi:putative NIF3 family GTP cyclohydrolase 1 type 2